MKSKTKLLLACVFFALFLVILMGVLTLDVAVVGPEDAKIGFSTLNVKWRDRFPLDLRMYDLTGTVGLIPIACAGAFAFLALTQLIRRKKLVKVDWDLILLMFVYALIGVLYVLFEVVRINYRPFILDPAEGLEASFPSSHTLLSVSIMGTAILQWKRRFETGIVQTCLIACSVLVMAFIVVGRVIAGVHWLTDILASVCLSLALVFLYSACIEKLDRLRRHRKKAHARRRKNV